MRASTPRSRCPRGWRYAVTSGLCMTCSVSRSLLTAAPNSSSSRCASARSRSVPRVATCSACTSWQRRRSASSSALGVAASMSGVTTSERFTRTVSPKIGSTTTVTSSVHGCVTAGSSAEWAWPYGMYWRCAPSSKLSFVLAALGASESDSSTNAASRGPKGCWTSSTSTLTLLAAVARMFETAWIMTVPMNVTPSM